MDPNMKTGGTGLLAAYRQTQLAEHVVLNPGASWHRFDWECVSCMNNFQVISMCQLEAVCGRAAIVHPAAVCSMTEAPQYAHHLNWWHRLDGLTK